MKKILALILVISMLFSYASVTHAEREAEINQALLDEINNNFVMFDETDTLTDDELNAEASVMSVSERSVSEDFKVEPVNSVYNVLNNNEDYVSQTTGALTYEKELLSLPGANGLDLSLSVKYNSGDAVFAGNEFEDMTETVRKINFNSFAVGWSFGFPAIIKSSVKQAYGWGRETQLYFPDGSGYKIPDDDSPSADKQLTLEGYKLSDMTLMRKADTKDYVLTYSDGTIQTFDGTFGNIKKITDRFGNEINFTYTELDYYRGSFTNYMFNPSYYEAKLNALTKITDSAGRIIDISYDMKNTVLGKEVDEIEIKMNDITYAVLKLEKVSGYNGNTSVLTQITDAEGYVTNFEYDECITNIYNSNPGGTHPEYTANGNAFLLKKVLPSTGGSISYEYEKSRRSYIYQPYNSIVSDWYEVFKVSRVSDSSGFERSYEYENDYSGYPYSHLEVEPYPEPTGEVHDETFKYLSIIRENGKTTISTFNYQHNKIEERVYDDSAKNDYKAGNGKPKWSILVGDNIYYMGFVDDTDITAGRTTKAKTFLYSKNVFSGEIKILKSCSEKLPADCVLKSHGRILFVFYKIGSGTTASPYMLKAKEYSIETNSWSDAGEIELGNSAGSKLYPENMGYTNSKFYFWPYAGDTTTYHAVYNPENFQWSITENNISISSLKHICNVGSKIYYNNGKTIYEYDIESGELVGKLFSSLSGSMNGGFTIGGRTFICISNYIYEFNYEEQTATRVFTGSNNAFNLNYYLIKKGADGNIYYIKKYADNNGEYPVYRFNPDAQNGKFVLVGKRIVKNEAVNVLSGGTAENPILYFVSDGVEEMKLSEQFQEKSCLRTTYEYNSYNQLVKSTSERISGKEVKNSGSESYTYIDGKSILSSHTDILGNKTTYEYTDSPYFIPTKITEYDGTDNAVETINTLSEDGKKIESSEAVYSDIKLKTAFLYGDAEKQGNVTSEILYEAQPDSTEYSIVRQTDFGYDESKTQIERKTFKNIVTNDSSFALSQPQDITVTLTHNPLGLVSSETDALGRTTSYEYNKNGWQTKTIYPDGTTKEFLYRLNGGENTISTVYNGGYTTIDFFDGLGRQIMQKETTAEGEETVLQRYEYDGHNVSKVYDAVGNYTVFNYDAFDRVTSVKNYDKENTLCANTTISFDDFNLSRTINNSGKISKTYYDIAGRTIKEETQSDAGLSATQTFYDYMGNVNKTISPKAEETHFNYNDRGLLTSVVNPLNQTATYTYNALNLPLTVTNAGELFETNTYDALGRILTTTDALGYSQKYAYDSADRLVAHSDKNGTVTSYTYKPNTDYLENQTKGAMQISYTYDDFGNKLTAENYTGTYEYEYYYNNQLKSIEAPDGKKITYSYNANHNVTDVVDYSGDIINYTYNGMNNITSITRNNQAVANYEYYDFGALKSVTYPNQGKSEFVYDNAMRLTSQTNSLADNTVINAYEYTYDLSGNQIQKRDNGNITSYTYDSLNRLSGVTDYDGTTTAYTFDNQGNIATKNISHPQDFEFSFKQGGAEYTIDAVTEHTFTYAYDKNNRLKYEGEYIVGEIGDSQEAIEITKYSEYDNNGNLLSTQTGGQVDESVVEYVYNPLNELSQFTDSSGNETNYYYTPDGLRSSKIHGGIETKFYWDRNYITAESVNGEITAQNYVGINGVFARETADTNYMLKNGHGDVVTLLNNGIISKSYDYDAYGVEKNIDSLDTNPFRYCGEYFDAESNQIYLRARYYDPSVGRFVTEDTHWNTNNMIYGDNQKAVKYSIVNDQKIYFDQYGKIVETEEYNPNILASLNVLGNDLEQYGIQINEIKRIPDLNAILQSSNLYVYGMNNPIKYMDQSGQSVTLTVAGTTIVKGLFYTVGVILAADLGEKVGNVLKTRLGKIYRAPLPPGFPGWDAIRDLTMGEILRKAQKGDKAYKEVWKLLTDGRFKK